MTDESRVVADTSALENLAKLRVDDRQDAPTGQKPLETVLDSYVVVAPEAVVGELSQTAAADDDLLALAADWVLEHADELAAEPVADDERPSTGRLLDEGEVDAVGLANTTPVEAFLCDEVNTWKFQLINELIDDQGLIVNSLRLLCELAADGVLSTPYVEQAAAYYADHIGWEQTYCRALQEHWL